MLDPVLLLRELIAFPSVSPHDGGAMRWLTTRLEEMGFDITILDTDVSNLYACIGDINKGDVDKVLCFGGHLDVVPPGDNWIHPPFAAELVDGVVYGRGAVDMKGAIACFLSAVHRFLKSNRRFGKICLMITSDEEGRAEDGTIRLVEYLRRNNIKISDCLLGEPTSEEAIGDAMKIGRRGSINFTLTVYGVQGHVAYPHLAKNPIDSLLNILAILKGNRLDNGCDGFQQSHLEITSVDVDNSSSNIIPSKAVAKFNIRFNPNHTANSLALWIQSVCIKCNINYDLRYDPPAEAFLSRKGKLYDVLEKILFKGIGKHATVSTSGGTSDGRFIAEICNVVELGLCNKYAHKVDERVEVADLYRLTKIYYEVLCEYFDEGGI